MEGLEEVRRDAALIAAARKWPLEIKTERGVEGEICEDGTLKGGGTSRRVRGW